MGVNAELGLSKPLGGMVHSERIPGWQIIGFHERALYCKLITTFARVSLSPTLPGKII
jgi:hypothetical protein